MGSGRHLADVLTFVLNNRLEKTACDAIEAKGLKAVTQFLIMPLFRAWSG